MLFNLNPGTFSTGSNRTMSAMARALTLPVINRTRQPPLVSGVQHYHLVEISLGTARLTAYRTGWDVLSMNNGHSNYRWLNTHEKLQDHIPMRVTIRL